MNIKLLAKINPFLFITISVLCFYTKNYVGGIGWFVASFTAYASYLKNYKESNNSQTKAPLSGDAHE